MSHKIIRRHQLHDSALFKLSSRRRLAKVLQTSETKLADLTKGSDRYREWDQEKKNGGVRHIEAPPYDLMRVQARIADLLSRIEPPDYLFNPAKGRSYVGNAGRHIKSIHFHLLDIANFYPSCTGNRVAWFFGTKMCCPPDVTAILTQLAVREGRLPQGSPCSSYLAFYAYLDMWEQIDDLVKKEACIHSVYADDITISGKQVPGKLVFAIKATVAKYGFSLKKDKEASVYMNPADITGVIVRDGKLLLPNRQHKLLHDLKVVRRSVKNPELRQKIDQKISGRVAQKNQIENALSSTPQYSDK